MWSWSWSWAPLHCGSLSLSVSPARRLTCSLAWKCSAVLCKFGKRNKAKMMHWIDMELNWIFTQRETFSVPPNPKLPPNPQPLSNGLGHSIVSRPVNWLILCMSTKMNAVLCSVPWPIENPFRLEFHCVRQSPMQMPHLYKVTIDDDLRSPLKLKWFKHIGIP